MCAHVTQRRGARRRRRQGRKDLRDRRRERHGYHRSGRPGGSTRAGDDVEPCGKALPVASSLSRLVEKYRTDESDRGGQFDLTTGQT